MFKRKEGAKEGCSPPLRIKGCLLEGKKRKGRGTTAHGRRNSGDTSVRPLGKRKRGTGQGKKKNLNLRRPREGIRVHRRHEKAKLKGVGAQRGVQKLDSITGKGGEKPSISMARNGSTRSSKRG